MRMEANSTLLMSRSWSTLRISHQKKPRRHRFGYTGCLQQQKTLAISAGTAHWQKPPHSHGGRPKPRRRSLALTAAAFAVVNTSPCIDSMYSGKPSKSSTGRNTASARDAGDKSAFGPDGTLNSARDILPARDISSIESHRSFAEPWRRMSPYTFGLWRLMSSILSFHNSEMSSRVAHRSWHRTSKIGWNAGLPSRDFSMGTIMKKISSMYLLTCVFIPDTTFLRSASMLSFEAWRAALDSMLKDCSVRHRMCKTSCRELSKWKIMATKSRERRRKMKVPTRSTPQSAASVAGIGHVCGTQRQFKRSTNQDRVSMKEVTKQIHTAKWVPLRMTSASSYPESLNMRSRNGQNLLATRSGHLHTRGRFFSPNRRDVVSFDSESNGLDSKSDPGTSYFSMDLCRAITCTTHSRRKDLNLLRNLSQKMVMEETQLPSALLERGNQSQHHHCKLPRNCTCAGSTASAIFGAGEPITPKWQEVPQNCPRGISQIDSSMSSSISL